MLTDSKMLENSRPRKRAVSAGKGVPWSDSQKIEAVTTYLMLGNLRQTGIALRIPEVTLRLWKAKEWWHDLEKELRTQDKVVLNNKLKKIVDNSLTIVSDRLENGDFIYDQKTGQLRRKPVGLKDVHKVATDMMTLQNKMITEEQHTTAQENIADKLAALAAEFAKVSEKIEQKPTVEVTDVVFIEAQEESFDEDVSSEEN